MAQITDTILMVRPSNFGFNEQTAENNSFQDATSARDDQQIKEDAIREFDNFVNTLREQQIEVVVVNDTPSPIKPDAIFPNNWFTTHDNGTIILYPMFAKNRQQERRLDVVEKLNKQFGFNKLIDFSSEENKNRILEGTGSMILDRVNKIVYACLSPRTNNDLLDDYCKRIGYQKVAFTAVDDNSDEIYHTNVMMALGVDFVVICLDAVKNMQERAALINSFEETDKKVIEITTEQMNKFAGNMLQVQNKENDNFLVMSKTAYNSLTPSQIEIIEELTNILPVNINTIEQYGGGSARCMMAEVFYSGL
jgi:hypothetical protein